MPKLTKWVKRLLPLGGSAQAAAQGALAQAGGDKPKVVEVATVELPKG